MSEYGYSNHGKAFDHDMFDTEITYAKTEKYHCRKTNKDYDIVKVGCDYAHLWHSEQGYPDTFATVKNDAIYTVNKFLEANPDCHYRCKFSGIYDARENFYESKLGLIHKSQEKEIPEGWDNYKRIIQEQEPVKPNIPDIIFSNYCDPQLKDQINNIWNS
jgi:hypothetical protein